LGHFHIAAAALVVLAMVTTACAADAVAPSLRIDPRRMDPSPLGSVTLLRPAPSAAFSVEHAIVSEGLAGPVLLAWYWDFDPDKGLAPSLFSICGPGSVCTLSPCLQAGAAATDAHRLLVVASDRALAEGAASPFDVPAGAAWDWAAWEIALTGKCP
jgi:hypothetical protein